MTTDHRADSQDIRRHPGGSIAFDFYRARATALRGQAMRDAATLKAALAGTLTMTAMLVIVMLVAAAPARTPDSHAAITQPKAVQIR